MTLQTIALPVLDVRDLRVSFAGPEGEVRAVDGVSFSLQAGETLGLVGESGCGKTVTALAIMRLIPSPPGRITGGQVWLNGVELLGLPENDMRRVRGAQIGMVFQEPMTSLNPVLTIGRQITEALEVHLDLGKKAAWRRAEELLRMVGIPDPTARLKDYPHQLSGGQRQRVMIAIALSCNPRIIIADEATTALDVTIQAQVLELLAKLAQDTGTALIIITHNLGVVARYASRVCVMYAGKIRESGSADQIYGSPRHPYTAGLLGSVPRLDSERRARLRSIEGEIPDPTRLPTGCAFRPRCHYAVEECARQDPPLEPVADGHLSACWEWRRVGLERMEAARP